MAQSPFAGMATRKIGTVTSQEAQLGKLTSIAPYKGAIGAVSKALMSMHGVNFPEPNKTNTSDGARVIWFGKDVALLIGPEPHAKLRDHAALTDQSDAWATVTLSGAHVEEVLARLVPVDLRPVQFGEGNTARTLLGHMNVSITRTEPNSFLILGFRSMAKTLCHDLETAMENVARRG